MKMLSHGSPSTCTLRTYFLPLLAPSARITSGLEAFGSARVMESKNGAPIVYSPEAGSTKSWLALARLASSQPQVSLTRVEAHG